jgi:flagellar biosynthesis chaperone FliJ
VTEPKDVVPDILRKMRREMHLGFQSIRRELNDIRQQLLMLTAAHNDLAGNQASHGEIAAIHSELSRLRQLIVEHDSRIATLEPDDEEN